MKILRLPLLLLLCGNSLLSFPQSLRPAATPSNPHLVRPTVYPSGVSFSPSPPPTITLDGFTLRHDHDSLYWLNDWRLPYPVYRFDTGDVDGDGSIDAMVGVIKPTRYFPQKGRRLFIFKLVNGKARPLWMGSKLGGTLHDFRFTDGKIRSLETTTDSLYVVVDYRWSGFGMAFDRFILKNVDEATALTAFYND